MNGKVKSTRYSNKPAQFVSTFVIPSCQPHQPKITTELTKPTHFAIGILAIPQNTKILEKIQTKGNFFSSMKFRVNESIELLKIRAKQLGGNAVRIEKIDFPGPFKSKSYDIIADVLLIEEQPKRYFEIVKGSLNDKSIYINLYRPNILFGSGLSYPVYLNDYFIGGLDNNSKLTIRFKEKIENLYFQIEAYGKLYKVPLIFDTDELYVKCKVSKDGSPKIEFQEISRGKKELGKINNAP